MFDSAERIGLIFHTLLCCSPHKYRFGTILIENTCVISQFRINNVYSNLMESKQAFQQIKDLCPGPLGLYFLGLMYCLYSNICDGFWDHCAPIYVMLYQFTDFLNLCHWGIINTLYGSHNWSSDLVSCNSFYLWHPCKTGGPPHC